MNNSSVNLARSPSILARAREIAGPSSNLVVTFCDSAYRDVLMNWLVPLRRHGEIPLLVFALDDDLAEHLERDGVPVVRVPCNKRVDAIWSMRAQVIHMLVAGGVNVIHSDVDAVWIKNPIELLEKIDADIVGSQGTVYPPECHRRWGHVICYGFIQFRASATTVSLLGEAAEMSSRERNFDDQCHLNNQLLARGIEWSVRSPYGLQFRDSSFACSLEPIVGDCPEGNGRIRVAIIPHAQVQRVPNDTEDPNGIYVSHPISQKDASDKREVLRDNRVWFLEDSIRA